MSSLHHTETERTTGDVEAKHLFNLFSRLIRKQADQSGATREEIKSDRVKENKVCLSVFLTLLSTLYSHYAPLCLKKTVNKFHFASYLEGTFCCSYGE